MMGRMCMRSVYELLVQRNITKVALCKRHYHAEHLRVSRMYPGLVSDSHALDLEQDDATCKSHKLMNKLNLTQNAAPGTHYVLPLLTRSLEKLHRLIDQTMQKVGAQKVTTPCLAPGTLWKASERWDIMGSELLKLQDRHDRDMCLAPTHEEAITSIVARMSPISRQRLPIKYYQIGRKFRDEMRPKNGLLRGREFEMKDLYTFDSNLMDAEKTYGEIFDAYSELFSLLDLNVIKVEADSGAMGGSRSHEYQLLSDIGEDTLLKCPGCGIYVSKELSESNPDIRQCGCSVSQNSPKWTEVRGIEVAHAFLLGTKYSKLFKARGYDEEEKVIDLQMGCYGIGVTRLLAAAAEVMSGDTYIRWPRLLAPHQICIIPQMKGPNCEKTLALAESLQEELLALPSLQNEVLLDERLRLSIGMRMKICDWYGFPYRIVLGKKAEEDPPLFEVNDIYTGEQLYLTRKQLVEKLSQIDTIII